jgi:hypothetical protein
MCVEAILYTLLLSICSVSWLKGKRQSSGFPSLAKAQTQVSGDYNKVSPHSILPFLCLNYHNRNNAEFSIILAGSGSKTRVISVFKFSSSSVPTSKPLLWLTGLFILGWCLSFCLEILCLSSQRGNNSMPPGICHYVPHYYMRKLIQESALGPIKGSGILFWVYLG